MSIIDRASGAQVDSLSRSRKRAHGDIEDSELESPESDYGWLDHEEESLAAEGLVVATPL